MRAIADPNPVMFFEHKALYRRIQGEVPESPYELSLGLSRKVRAGESLSLITYGLGVHWALDLCESQGYTHEIEIIDLQCLIPWDKAAVMESVKKTGKCLVLYEATYTGSFGAEIAASVGEHCFEYLDGPVLRVGSLDTPVPFHPKLEEQFLASARLKAMVEELLAY